jgi:uncharacterized protein YndB with AHSA1/START domain
MDHYAMLPRPVATVFADLARPARLCDWLAEVVQVDADPAATIGVGTPLALTVLEGGTVRVVDGEVVGYEPPWLIAYRIFLTQPQVLRLTCTASDGGTRVHVHQSDDPTPLTVDLTRLPVGEQRGARPAGGTHVAN